MEGIMARTSIFFLAGLSILLSQHHSPFQSFLVVSRPPEPEINRHGLRIDVNNRWFYWTHWTHLLRPSVEITLWMFTERP